jgi:hypothetical protein
MFSFWQRFCTLLAAGLLLQVTWVSLLELSVGGLFPLQIKCGTYSLGTDHNFL